MKIEIDNYGEKKTISCNDEIIISGTNYATVQFNGKSCLKVWVDGQIIYIYPKGGDRDSTDVVFMDKVISSDN